MFDDERRGAGQAPVAAEVVLTTVLPTEQTPAPDISPPPSATFPLSTTHGTHNTDTHTMQRTVADATRFTATGPHAFSQSPLPSSSTETAQQRVARLREAARRTKKEQAAGTAFERLLDRGRVVADKAHRVVAVGLIAGTVLAGAVTVYAITDMMVFNRRRRAELGIAKVWLLLSLSPLFFLFSFFFLFFLCLLLIGVE